MLFKKDINKKIEHLVKKNDFYAVADYSQSCSTHYFYLISRNQYQLSFGQVKLNQ